MQNKKEPKVAIVDYGMGNLYSVWHACNKVGLCAELTNSKKSIQKADAVILPGVGAFSNAMKNLKELDLIKVLEKTASSSKPILAICLGMQLLMSHSYEFGFHHGLNFFSGSVVPFRNSIADTGKRIKVPHIGWNQINKSKKWENSLLKDLYDGDFMYFIHSFYVEPKEPDIVLSKTTYGETNFCSSLQYENIIGFQFHPERSGGEGLSIYRNLASRLKL